jgi:hypothetical protein
MVPYGLRRHNNETLEHHCGGVNARYISGGGEHLSWAVLAKVKRPSGVVKFVGVGQVPGYKEYQGWSSFAY